MKNMKKAFKVGLLIAGVLSISGCASNPIEKFLKDDAIAAKEQQERKMKLDKMVAAIKSTNAETQDIDNSSEVHRRQKERREKAENNMPPCVDVVHTEKDESITFCERPDDGSLVVKDFPGGDKLNTLNDGDCYKSGDSYWCRTDGDPHKAYNDTLKYQDSGDWELAKSYPHDLSSSLSRVVFGTQSRMYELYRGEGRHCVIGTTDLKTNETEWEHAKCPSYSSWDDDFPKDDFGFSEPYRWSHADKVRSQERLRRMYGDAFTPASR